ncbi:hypothetical protein ACJMK2_036214 [Sinanodonta woodiana]|uniref:EGF-like domain-containing protein n=1 Tax=Sinanodonta woodiana TaxID=1069815 RepID=A0ABD3WJX3_SINWO
MKNISRRILKRSVVIYLLILDINECVSEPCLYGGTCIDRVNGYQCVCPAGRQGTHCQLDSDECAGQPCMNAVTCQDLLGDYHCQCQAGWTGKNCDTSKSKRKER